jgi:hypothetical protein
MSNARKLFRIFKWLIEYKKINVILGKADSTALHKLILAIIPRIAFFFYWILDSVIVLSKIKFLTGVNDKWITHKWATLWTIANFTGALGAIVELVEVGKEEARLIAEKAFQIENKNASGAQVSCNTQNEKNELKVKEK